MKWKSVVKELLAKVHRTRRSASLHLFIRDSYFLRSLRTRAKRALITWHAGHIKKRMPTMRSAVPCQTPGGGGPPPSTQTKDTQEAAGSQRRTYFLFILVFAFIGVNSRFISLRALCPVGTFAPYANASGRRTDERRIYLFPCLIRSVQGPILRKPVAHSLHEEHLWADYSEPTAFAIWRTWAT